MKIVLTRPYDDSLKMKKLIESRSKHHCFIHPILDIEILDKQVDIPSGSVVIITSLNGLRALAQNCKLRDFEMITVGNTSCKEALRLGYRNVRSAVETKTQSASEPNLIQFVKTNIDKTKPIYHISANITKGALKKKLTEAGYKYNRVVLYNSCARDFSPVFISQLLDAEFDAFTFFSPRSAALFSKQVFENGLTHVIRDVDAFCFSENVITGLNGLHLRKIHIPEVTSTENFVNMLHDY